MRPRFLLLFVPIALLAQPGRFGLPSCSAPDQELAVRSAFLLCHSSSLRVPLWTAHQLTSENLAPPFSRPRRFRRDTALAHPGAHDSDYRHSRYSRGHAVPAAGVASSEQAVRDSFLLSNVLPQNSSLNSGKWRLLEKAIRRLAAAADFVVLFTGPIFCTKMERIGVNRVAVPCQLYKVVVAARGPELAAFATILPNDSNPAGRLDEFATSVAEVERRTGLDFFGALPAAVQHLLESPVQTLPYGGSPVKPGESGCQTDLGPRPGGATKGAPSGDSPDSPGRLSTQSTPPQPAVLYLQLDASSPCCHDRPPAPEGGGLLPPPRDPVKLRRSVCGPHRGHEQRLQTGYRRDQSNADGLVRESVLD